MNKKGILYWITGLSGAGKTTIGNKLYYELREKQDNVILLDGDILKNIVDNYLGYSVEERRTRAMKYAKLSKALTDQGMVVICCTIAMFDEVRGWNRKNNKGYVEVFLDVPMTVLKERDQKGMYSQYSEGTFSDIAGVDMEVELPKLPDIILKNDGSLSLSECVSKIINFEVLFSHEFDRDKDYWNEYYKSNPDIKSPSKFALSLKNTLESGKNIIELGCGNARDSLFFAEMGLYVTAIDVSNEVILRLKKAYKKRDNITFICDDFVCSKALFMGQFDYCYSRFTIHAINAEQEMELIHNISTSLKEKGIFFIEVRSIRDELFGKGDKIGYNEYVYNGHYRRFIVKEELEQNLINEGFIITFAEEQRGFAPFDGSDPYIIRIIAQKVNILPRG